jgi:long-subunit fatty acid transport protein
MIQRLLVIILVCITSTTVAQEATSSPYSFFGIGSLNFRGTVENRSMAGLGVYSDSIHLNLQNPSGLAHLKLVTFTVGGAHKYVSQETANESGSATSTSINYLAMGMPITDRIGAGFGVLPLTSVGYSLQGQVEDGNVQNRGRGGMNKVFVNLGYRINDNFSVGIDANYNFGNIINTTLLSNPDVEFATRETNRSNLSGFSFDLGATYRTMVTDKLELFSSLTYTPETRLDSENFRQFASVFAPNIDFQIEVDVRDVVVEDSRLTLPSEVTLGLGIGEPRKWFIGAEYTTQGANNFSNRAFNLDNVEFSEASRYKIGGFYVPRHTALSGYFNKVTYRAGLRYEDTGLRINNEDINEFGITFGVGLPVGRMFSNFNVGFEIGSRGTTNNGLVKENFFNTIISLSLNDRWFIKTLYD